MFLQTHTHTHSRAQGDNDEEDEDVDEDVDEEEQDEEDKEDGVWLFKPRQVPPPQARIEGEQIAKLIGSMYLPLPQAGAQELSQAVLRSLQ